MKAIIHLAPSMRGVIRMKNALDIVGNGFDIAHGLRTGYLFDAPSADHHGEDANADGDDLNHGRQLQHQQNSDKQFGQNHDDFINVTVERFYHVGSLLTKGL